MELQHIITEPGDVVIPPYDDSEGEYAILVFYEDEEYTIALDDELFTNVTVHESQVDDLIEALKTVKENHA